MRIDVTPDIIIGDLDSIDSTLLNQHQYLHEPCQNSSDFQKALKYLQEQSLLPAIIVGMNGGYLDHILNNINIFIETKNLFYTPPLLGFTISEGQNDDFSSGEKSNVLSVII